MHPSPQHSLQSSHVPHSPPSGEQSGLQMPDDAAIPGALTPEQLEELAQAQPGPDGARGVDVLCAQRAAYNRWVAAC